MAEKPTSNANAKAKKPAAVVKTAPAPKAPAPVAKATATPAPVPAPAPKPVTPPQPVQPVATAPVAAKAQAPQEGPKTEPAPVTEQPAAVSQATPVLEATAPPAAVKVSIKELKEKIMATTPNFDASKVTETVTAAFSEMQDKAKVAYEKSTAAVGDMTDFAKGNVEAMVESGKILAGAVQDMSKTAVEEAKSAYELATADLKEMAAIKSPTELFQIQGKIARRNFDAMVAASSKNTEAMMKLASEVFAPVSGRINVAVEKISKAA